MDSLIIFVIIGIIWVFQIIAKQNQDAGQDNEQEKKKPEWDIFEEFRNLMEKGRQADGRAYPGPPDLYEDAKREIAQRKTAMPENRQTEEAETDEEEQDVPEPVEQVQAGPQAKEALLEKIFNKYKPEVVIREPQAEITPAPDFSGNLSAETLEQGIIISVVLGPPKSTQMLKRINRFQ